MRSREQGAKSRESILSAGRKAESLTIAACLLFLTLNIAATAHAAFTFDDIEYWVGEGPNRSALAIDWVENASDPPALVWGYRWDGAAKGRDLLAAIVAADPRLFAKFGGSPDNEVAVYGLGYDADNDAHFGIDDGTTFDTGGIAYSGPADLAQPTDPGDYYAEGWFTGFWHYGVEAPDGSNPFDGSGWKDIPVGMAGRDLADGSWDSWVYSPTFNFAAFAENPQAAPPLFVPGDFNHDGRVDAADYDEWTRTFGSTSQLAADANGNGIVDAADYIVWREHFSKSPMSADIGGALAAPEPANPVLVITATFVIGLAVRSRTLITTNRH